MKMKTTSNENRIVLHYKSRDEWRLWIIKQNWSKPKSRFHPPPTSYGGSTLIRNPNPDAKTSTSTQRKWNIDIHVHAYADILSNSWCTIQTKETENEEMRREGYSCISDFKNEINQWKSFGDGTRGRSHVRAVPSSSCGQCAYLPCQFSRCCHLGYWLHYSKSSLLVSVLADRPLFVFGLVQLCVTD